MGVDHPGVDPGGGPGKWGGNPEGGGIQVRTEGGNPRVQEPRGGETQRVNPGLERRNEDT